MQSKLKGTSFFTVSFFTQNETTKPQIPSISKILAILLPMILPKTMSPLPLMVAKIFTTTSGTDVPKASRVSPIINSGTLK